MSAAPDNVEFPTLPDAERGPTTLRITLGGQLRALREAKGISREAAGEAIRGSHAKISRLELGRTGFKERDVRDLLTLYGVHDAHERAMLIDLVRRANSPGWWHQYGDLLPPWFQTYIGLEQAATTIRTYEAQLVPGLLQTPEYVAAVLALHYQGEELHRRTEMRLRRQQILDREQPPTLWAVLDEAALRRPIGGVEVLRTQLDHLIEIGSQPHVTLQALPYEASGHGAAVGPFSIVRFAERELPDVVYIEQLTSALYLDKRQDVEQYLTAMDQLSVQALTPEASVDFLKQIRSNV